jgi:conjugal transfer pilus assembly protein TraF
MFLIITNKLPKLLFLWVILITPISNCFALNPFYENSERGWYYFEDLSEEEKKVKKAKEDKKQPNENKPIEKNKITTPLSEMDGNQVLETLSKVQKELQVRQARYVLEPTIKNTRSFLEYQQQMFENGTRASDAMASTLLKYPYLDPRIENPIADQAIKIKNLEQKEQDNKKIDEFASHFKFYYFFKGSCSYCKEFSPVLDRVAKTHNFKIEAISLDGSKSEKFTSKMNDKLVKNLKVENTPTLIGYNSANNIYVPIANGFMPENDLKLNIIHVYDHLINLTLEVKE